MPRRFLAALAAALSVVVLPACVAAVQPPVVAATAPTPPPPGPEAKFHVLMINGGGNPDINFQPHLLHLRSLREMLLASGIHADQISVFSSDGEDPAPDLVSRGEQPEKDFWMLRSTRLEHPLEMPRVLVSSEIPGAQLQAATKAGLKKWFEEEARTLKPGDTLLLYVTDHGNKTGPDPMTNSIQLWGKDEQLSVKDLGELLHGLAPGVHVVSVMSQCFSGGFAGLSTATADPHPNVCGYFSSTADRPAYGCFPENIGKERVGHSFHFLRALESGRQMTMAHEATLLADDTPDVPLRSSDEFLRQLLLKAATERAVSIRALAADLLGPSWRDKPEWQAERALADRIAGEYGLVSPQSLADIDAQRDDLAELERGMGMSAQAWGSALGDATGDNLDNFLAANPAWKERVSDEALKKLDGNAARVLTASLLSELVPWTRKDKGDRLDVIAHKKKAAEEGAYRTEVRVAVALRLEVLMTSLAGRAYLERFGSQAERDDYAALRACENVTLPGPAPTTAPATGPTELLAAFPSISDERKLELELHPSWIGIGFDPNPLREDVRKDRGLPSGVSLITSVYPTSPAKDAGLEIGDLVLGPPGQPFTARNQIRAWTMLTPAGQKGTLKVLRGTKELELTIAPRLHPGALPPVPPESPAVGSAAPPLNLRNYRGAKVSLADGKAHLLLFWETWCGPCKASVPEVLAYERTHHVEVVAITDEPPATLDTFFAQWKTPFPKTVAIDDLRTAHLAYGVPATPTYVLIDEKGIVRAKGVGYGRPAGLQIAGWKWDGK